MKTPIADMVLEMHGKGIPVELIADAVAKIEEAMAARAVSTGSPVDTSIMEKRRAWDRERKRRQREARNSTGTSTGQATCPPDVSTGIPPEVCSILKKEASNKEVLEKKESKKDARGTRCPPDFAITDEDRKFAIALGIPPEAVEAETPQFIDYWSGIPGHRGLKTNWKGTWRNRMRDIAKYRAARSSGKPLTEFQRKQQETNDVRAQLRAYASGSGSGRNADRILPPNHGERSEDLRGGPRQAVLAIPRALDRGSS